MSDIRYTTVAVIGSHDRDQLKQALLSRLEEVLYYLLPAGKIHSGHFYVGNVEGQPGNSMKVVLQGIKAGLWYDYAENNGGDILDLWAKVHRLNTRTDFPILLEEIRHWLGVAPPIKQARPCHQPIHPAKKPLGPVTGKWDYHAANGQLLASVYRYDPPGEKKQFRPYDAQKCRWQPPEPRPLYNLPALHTATEVWIAEGEKSAQALIHSGLVATTAMNGSQAPTCKTDWSPLCGKHITIWPDKDQAGWDYADAVAQAALQAGAKKVSILVPPDDQPEKWDAADAVAAGMDIASLITTTERRHCQPPKTPLTLTNWNANRFSGSGPKQHFLVDGIIPMASVSLLAAMGDAGKGMLLLNLGLQVATGTTNNQKIYTLGGCVQEFGTAVIFTAEDDQDEVHRRLARLDPDNQRVQCAKRLLVIPLPNAGGPIPLVQSSKDGPHPTPHFEAIRTQLLQLPNLKLVVFDPLASFVHADVNADPAAGSFVTGLLATLATETGAAVLIAHHMRKTIGNFPITNTEQARDAIRGTSAIVDGVRTAYALWPAPVKIQEEIFRMMEQPLARHALFQGAVVKANGPADRNLRTYLRHTMTGLLVDISPQISGQNVSKTTIHNLLVASIQTAASNGCPFTHCGESGVYQQRDRLPQLFQDMGRNRLESMVQGLLDEPSRLVKGMANGSKIRKWLDVPTGPFAEGIGQLAYD